MTITQDWMLKARSSSSLTAFPNTLGDVGIGAEERDADAALAHGAIGAITILSAPVMLQWNELKLC